MVLVDTSVWIAQFRKREAAAGEMLHILATNNEAAVCGQVLVEFIGGFRDAKLRENYLELMLEFPLLETTREDFIAAARLISDHPRLGPGDSTIAAVALRNRIPLFTLDKGFNVLAHRGLVLFG